MSKEGLIKHLLSDLHYPNNDKEETRNYILSWEELASEISLEENHAALHHMVGGWDDERGREWICKDHEH